jgi:hypothetical protein
LENYRQLLPITAASKAGKIWSVNVIFIASKTTSTAKMNISMTNVGMYQKMAAYLIGINLNSSQPQTIPARLRNS